MAGFGNFPNLTWANGVAPAINEVNLQSAWDNIEAVDNELRRSQTLNAKDLLEYFFNVNCKEVDNFTDYAEYTAWASTTLSNDTTNNCMGKNAVKTLESDNTASYVGMWKNITAMDLTNFPDAASDTSDIVMCVFYISDVSKVDTVTYKLGTDNANNYNVTYAAATCATGWNVKRPKKSDFSTTGAPAGWNNITYIVFQWYSKVNSQNAYITFQYCALYREDATYANYYNMFQKYFGVTTGWVNQFEMTFDYFVLYVDEAISRLGILKVDPTDNENNLYLGSQEYTSFISKWEFFCKKAGYIPSIVWHVDANNYAEAYISANVLYLDVVQGGVLASQTSALSVNLLLNERVELYFEKDGDSIKVILNTNKESLKILTKETTIADDSVGYIYLGSAGTSSYGLLTDFLISSTPGHRLPEKNTYIAVKQTASTINNDTAYTADPELFLVLPTGLWEVEFNLGVYNAASDTPDFKTDWSLTNCTEITFRSCSGPARAVTDADDTTMQARRVSTSLGIGYGVSTEYVNITEKAIIQVLGATGTVTLRRGQYTAHASNTIVESKSYGIAKKIS
jgi:hypothetical protein